VPLNGARSGVVNRVVLRVSLQEGLEVESWRSLLSRRGSFQRQRRNCGS